jgi:hypothetical protein
MTVRREGAAKGTMPAIETDGCSDAIHASASMVNMYNFI